MKDRKEQDYSDARRGRHNPVEEGNVHSRRQDDYQNLRRGKSTSSVGTGTGHHHQDKSKKGY